MKCPNDCNPPSPIEITNSCQAALFYKISIPASLGDDTTIPPEAGAYRNVLVVYEANGHSYLYSSDGMFTKVSAGDDSVSSVNGMVGDVVLTTSDLENTAEFVNQTELADGLNTKQNVLTAGDNITIIGDVISAVVDTSALEGEIEQQQQALADEISARQNADASITSSLTAETQAREQADTVLTGNLANEVTNREQADTELQNQIDTLTTSVSGKAEQSALTQEISDRQSADTNLQTQITTNAGNIATNTQSIQTESQTRAAADTNLQDQIDAITSASDVVDVVGTYQELEAYETSKLTDNDIVKVLEDDTHDNATSYYRWENAWQYIGSLGPFYTKSEADSTFVPQTTTINGEALSGNITLTAAQVGAATTEALRAETTSREQADTALQAQIGAIEVPTKVSELANDTGFITAAQAPVQSVNGQTGAVVIEAGAISPATTTTLGGIIVGNNLSITPEGVLSASAQGITVDSSLSTTSTNPVQNQVITNALNGKQATLNDEQLNAVNSGITSADVATYNGYAAQISAKLDETAIETFENVSVLASAWSADHTYSEQGYGFRATIPLTGITDSYIPNVVFSLADAESGNFAPISETYNGGVYIYAKSTPSDTITISSIVCTNGAD